MEKARKHKKRQLEDTLQMVMKKRKVVSMVDIGFNFLLGVHFLEFIVVLLSSFACVFFPGI